jgi:hypothetical protein
VYQNLNKEGKDKLSILKNINHLNSGQLEDWGHCWKAQKNIDENSSVLPQVLCQGYNYPQFVECTKPTNEYYVPLKKGKKKMVNVATVVRQTFGLLYNLNFVISNIEQDADVDHIDDSSNGTMPSLSLVLQLIALRHLLILFLLFHWMLCLLKQNLYLLL